MVVYNFILVVLLHVLFKGMVVECCPSICRCANSSLYCFYQGITTNELIAMSSTIPADTTKLYLSGNQIEDFPIQNFSHLKKLRYLSLSFNQLTTMPLNVSAYFPALTELYLNANEINEIPELRGYENLEVLDLNENKVRTLSDFSFRELRSLKELLLGKNQIQNITSNVFYGLEKLEKLKLNNNGLEYIDETAFHSTGNLKEIYLHVNKLSQVQNNLFSKLKGLETLYLRNNNIEHIGGSAFSDLNIHVMYLNSNRLSKLSTSAFNRIRIREKIYMGDNDFLCTCQLAMSIKMDKNFRKLLYEDKIDLGKCISRNHLSKVQIKSLNDDANCTMCDVHPCRQGLTCVSDNKNPVHYKCIDEQSTTTTITTKVKVKTSSTNRPTKAIVSTVATNLIGEHKFKVDSAEADETDGEDYMMWVIAIVCLLIGCSAVALITWLLYQRNRRREFQVNGEKRCSYDKVHYSSDTLVDITMESTDSSPVDV